jgi:hypothetical protein
MYFLNLFQFKNNSEIFRKFSGSVILQKYPWTFS